MGWLLEDFITELARDGELEVFLIHTADHGDLKRSYDEMVVNLDISSMGDEESVEYLRNMRLDVAIDLNGFTRGFRPYLFLSRIAPLQLTWLGFPGKVALSAFDGIIVDSFIARGAEGGGRPKLYFLEPLYQPIRKIRKIEKIDRKNKPFIFGSFNDPKKITRAIVRSWAEILNKTNSTRLAVYAADNIAYLTRLFESEGLQMARVDFLPRVSREEHISRIAQVDLVLDTYPFNGHTTTLEAILARTPVLTISGGDFHSRVAGSIIRAYSDEKFICDDISQYVDKAVEYTLADERERGFERICSAGIGRADEKFFFHNKFGLEVGLNISTRSLLAFFESEGLVIRNSWCSVVLGAAEYEVQPQVGSSDFGLKEVAGYFEVLVDPQLSDESQTIEETSDTTIRHDLVVFDGSQVEMFFTSYPACSSIYKPSGLFRREFPEFSDALRIERTATVNTVQLKDLVELNSVAELTLDIQGAEYVVLADSLENLANCNVIRTEVTFREIYEGAPPWVNLVGLLHGAGFDLMRMFPPHTRRMSPFGTRNNHDVFATCLWTDMVFLRRAEWISRQTNEAIIFTILVLWARHGAIDVIFNLLRHIKTTGQVNMQSAFVDFFDLES